MPRLPANSMRLPPPGAAPYNADMGLFARAKTFALDLLFPLSCAGCGTEGAYLCAPCAADIPMYAPACIVCKKLVPAHGDIPAGKTCTPCRKKSRIYASFSPFSYDTPAIKTLIHDLKYRRVAGNAEILGALLSRAIAYHGILLSRDSVIIPIPLHPSRERTRGFNQAQLIADALGAKLGISVRADLLKKIKNTRPQMDLPREERLKNVTGAFAVSDSDTVRNRTCILMDDVKTTGATLESAARVLRAAGAKRVWAITVAR